MNTGIIKTDTERNKLNKADKTQWKIKVLNKLKKYILLLFIGGVGNWKKHLTVETSEFVDLKMKEDLGDDWNKIDFVYSL